MDEMTLEKEAMRLSARERASLADALLESLSDEATRQIQDLWAAEAEDRLQAFWEGKISARDAHEALKDAISKLSPGGCDFSRPQTRNSLKPLRTTSRYRRALVFPCRMDSGSRSGSRNRRSPMGDQSWM